VYTLELELSRLAPYMAQVPPAQGTFVDAQAMLAEVPQSLGIPGMRRRSGEFARAARKRPRSGHQIFAG
jgi:hypothetical protein